MKKKIKKYVVTVIAVILLGGFIVHFNDILEYKQESEDYIDAVYESKTERLRSILREQLEIDAYNTFEEKYGFNPVAFGELPDDLQFNTMAIEEPKVRMQYTGTNGRTLELIIIIPGYGRENEIVDVEGEFQINYELQTDEFLVNVNQYRDRNTKKMIMHTYFVRPENVKYHIVGYDIAPTEFDEIVRNITE